MRVSDAMTREPRLARPDQTIREVARLMADADTGFMPVEEDDRMVGTVTDRDICIRAVAAGLGPDTPVREVMSPEVLYCFEDDDLEEVCENMADLQVRRMPVVNREKRLVGVISIGDIARAGDGAAAGPALADICEPGGDHVQRMN